MSEEWFPWYPTLYEADTLHLTVAQDGIYRRLIDWYMQKRRPLPNNAQALAAICRIGLAEWEENAAVVLPFFRAKGAELHHKRCNEVLDQQDKRSGQRSEIAKKGAEARWSKSKGLDANSMPEASEQHAVSNGAASYGAGEQHARDDATLHDKTVVSSLRSDTRPSAREELETVLDAERASAVVDHRKRLRKPLTAHAAKLLAEKLKQCADPNFAADTMIANGWQGFEPEWMDNRKPTKSNGVHDPTPPKDDAEAEKRLKLGREQKRWPRHKWGPAPNEPGCLIPAYLVQPTDDGWAEWSEAH